MTVIGGLRARLLQDSLRLVLDNGLADLGWFNPNRTHKPLRFLPEPQDWDHPIAFNSMVVSTRSRSTEEIEVGSHFNQDTARVTVDIYAENDSLALDLANDIRDLIRGRLPLGLINGTFSILDLRMATPTALGYARIGEVRMTRVAPQPTSPHSLYWFGVDVDVHDYYYDSGESP